MSASLVGSEMCIRDRPRAPRTRATHHVARTRPGSPERAPEGRAAAAEAVSYTHLTLPTICSV
eukprot:2409719-Alexandrium_andersonii.AAC.1